MRLLNVDSYARVRTVNWLMPKTLAPRTMSSPSSGASWSPLCLLWWSFIRDELFMSEIFCLSVSEFSLFLSLFFYFSLFALVLSTYDVLNAALLFFFFLVTLCLMLFRCFAILRCYRYAENHVLFDQCGPLFHGVSCSRYVLMERLAIVAMGPIMLRHWHFFLIKLHVIEQANHSSQSNQTPKLQQQKNMCIG